MMVALAQYTRWAANWNTWREQMPRNENLALFCYMFSNFSLSLIYVSCDSAPVTTYILPGLLKLGDNGKFSVFLSVSLILTADFTAFLQASLNSILSHWFFQSVCWFPCFNSFFPHLFPRYSWLQYLQKKILGSHISDPPHLKRVNNPASGRLPAGVRKQKQQKITGCILISQSNFRIRIAMPEKRWVFFIF